MKTLILFVLLFPTLAISHAAEWEKVTHDGRDYVTARSIKDFYGFDSMEKTGDVLILQNKAVEMRLTIGGQEVFMNQIKFIFDAKILAHDDRYLVSRSDVAKMVDPVLRPQDISSTAPFKTVIVDAGHGGEDVDEVLALHG